MAVLGTRKRRLLNILAGVLILIVFFQLVLGQNYLHISNPQNTSNISMAQVVPTTSVHLPVISKLLAYTQWPQLAGNPQRTGYVDFEIPTPWKVLWIWNGPLNGGDGSATGGHLRLPKDVQPVVGGGNLYIGHSDGYLRAISQANGQQVWATNLGNAITNTAAYDAATNSVYAGTSDGRFWRLDASSGQVIRSNRPSGIITMAPLLVGNTVYIGNSIGQFYAFDKSTLVQLWMYTAGAALVGSPAYSDNHAGLIILLAEDKSVHAVQAANGARRWRVTVNGDVDPIRGTVFADTYPVISEIYDSVIVRSYINWDKIWQPNGGAPTSVSEIRNYLTQNPSYQSFFVLSMDNGSQRYVAPVMPGGIGNGGDLEAPPPQAVVKSFPDGTEVAYVLWRSRSSCSNVCDGREDTTIGEMNLATGDIRFMQDYKSQGSMRLPTDEQSPLSMAGNTLFHAHWMLLGAIRITDRSANLGGSYSNPIRAAELTPVLNTLSSNLCSSRGGHYCGTNMQAPCDGFGVDPGFYIYYAGACVYDQYWTTAVRSAVFSNNTIYWKSVDGAIIAISSANP